MMQAIHEVGLPAFLSVTAWVGIVAMALVWISSAMED